MFSDLNDFLLYSQPNISAEEDRNGAKGESQEDKGDEKKDEIKKSDKEEGKQASKEGDNEEKKEEDKEENGEERRKLIEENTNENQTKVGCGVTIIRSATSSAVASIIHQCSILCLHAASLVLTSSTCYNRANMFPSF